MKLKKFTIEETQQLIVDLNEYWDLCSTITGLAELHINEVFIEHNRNYKWDWKHPFTRRVETVEEMTYKLSGGQFRTIDNGFMLSKKFTKYLSCWFGDANRNYYFTNKKHYDIVVAASKVGFWNNQNYDIAKFHELTEQYAEHPLEPTADDIDIIRMVRQRLFKMKTYMEEYNAI